jgi:hypothetical protein
MACHSKSGDEEHIEWAKIHTPTDEVVVPYDTLEASPEGDNLHILLFSLILIWKCKCQD